MLVAPNHGQGACGTNEVEALADRLEGYSGELTM